MSEKTRGINNVIKLTSSDRRLIGNDTWSLLARMKQCRCVWSKILTEIFEWLK